VLHLSWNWLFWYIIS